jgi:hypothetical protein
VTGSMPGGRRFQRSQITSPADLVPGAVKAERRYEGEAAEVTRVLVRVERGDGSVREYEAAEPRSCEVTTGMTGGEGGHSWPTLNLWLTANPRLNLHIRTHEPWAQCPSCAGRQDPAPPAQPVPVVPPGQPAGEGGPAVTHLGIFMGYENGAVREYTVTRPRECVLVHLNEDAPEGAEPKLAIVFAGNPQEGGVQVHSEGKV